MKLRKTVNSILSILSILLMWVALILILVHRNLTVDLPILWVGIILILSSNLVKKRRQSNGQNTPL